MPDPAQPYPTGAAVDYSAAPQQYAPVEGYPYQPAPAAPADQQSAYGAPAADPTGLTQPYGAQPQGYANGPHDSSAAQAYPQDAANAPKYGYNPAASPGEGVKKARRGRWIIAGVTFVVGMVVMVVVVALSPPDSTSTAASTSAPAASGSSTSTPATPTDDAATIDTLTKNLLNADVAGDTATALSLTTGTLHNKVATKGLPSSASGVTINSVSVTDIVVNGNSATATATAQITMPDGTSTTDLEHYVYKKTDSGWKVSDNPMTPSQSTTPAASAPSPAAATPQGDAATIDTLTKNLLNADVAGDTATALSLSTGALHDKIATKGLPSSASGVTINSVSVTDIAVNGNSATATATAQITMPDGTSTTDREHYVYTKTDSGWKVSDDPKTPVPQN